jgi:hypothetical protein
MAEPTSPTPLDYPSSPASLLPHREAAWIVLEERLREACAFGKQLDGPPELGIERVCTALERQAARLASDR